LPSSSHSAAMAKRSTRAPVPLTAVSSSKAAVGLEARARRTRHP
jgi:hypothetical protein